MYQPLKTRSYKYAWVLLVPIGLLGYMFHLKQTTGDWLAFLHALPSFGEQRSSLPVLLPQVFYRYIFKILPNLNYSYFPVVFTTLMEFIVAIIYSLFSLLSLFKLRLSYALLLIGGFILPTLTGSFSSLPRYVLVLFPGFILMSLYLSRLPVFLRAVICIALFLLLQIATSLFVRGYWVS